MTRPHAVLKLKTPPNWWKDLELVGVFNGCPRVGLRNIYSHPGVDGFIRATQTFEVVKRTTLCKCCRSRVTSTHFFSLHMEGWEDVYSPVDIWSTNSHPVTKDHIKPRRNGGKDVMENYMTLCARCNVYKGHATGPVFCQGFINHALRNGTARHYKRSSSQKGEWGVSPKTLEKMKRINSCFNHSQGWTPTPINPLFPRPGQTSQ